MSFPQAVSSVLRQYVGFSGRARRSEYWWWILFTLLVSIAVSLVENVLGLASETGGGPLSGLVALALLLPNLAVSVRRLHDTGRSGWWILLGLIPLVGPIILIVWFVGDSAPDNQYGPNPKGATGQPYGAGYAQPEQPRF